MCQRKMFMIKIKRCNFITGDTHSVSYGLNQILNFFELVGKNILIFHPDPKYFRGYLTYFFNNRKSYSSFEDLKSQVLDDGVLFKVDLLILDIWHLKNLDIDYLNLIKSTGIDFIIVSRNYHYLSSDDVCDYHISVESGSKFNMDKYIITDKINGWKSDIDSLKKSYIRDIKIDILFGNE